MHIKSTNLANENTVDSIEMLQKSVVMFGNILKYCRKKEHVSTRLKILMKV